MRGIRVAENDEVCGVALVEPGKKLVTITENGYGKLTCFEDFRTMKNRGGKGVSAHNITEKTGLLASIASVDDGDDLMLITQDGTMIRVPVSGIPTYSRTAGGVIVMRLSEGAKIVNFAKVESEEQLAKKAGAAALEQRAVGTAAPEKAPAEDGEDGERQAEADDEI